jgi:hypothetical protein
MSLTVYQSLEKTDQSLPQQNLEYIKKEFEGI